MKLVARRMRTVMWHCRGYPGSLPLLLEGPELAATKIAELKEACTKYKELVPAKRGAFWNNCRERTSLGIIAVKQVHN